MKKKSAYNYDDLIKCGNGQLFGPGNARLPLPPMLMFDRITEIIENRGDFKKGVLKAELDIKNDLWFFDCHFKEDPVMPGCLGLDAMWQLVGFYLGWLGNPGRGRALGVGTALRAVTAKSAVPIKTTGTTLIFYASALSVG